MPAPHTFRVTLPSGTRVVLEDPGGMSMGEFLDSAPRYVRDAWALHCDRDGLLPPLVDRVLREVVLAYFAERVCVDPPASTLSDEDRAAVPRCFDFQARRDVAQEQGLQAVDDSPPASVTRLSDRRR